MSGASQRAAALSAVVENINSLAQMPRFDRYNQQRRRALIVRRRRPRPEPAITSRNDVWREISLRHRLTRAFNR